MLTRLRNVKFRKCMFLFGPFWGMYRLIIYLLQDKIISYYYTTSKATHRSTKVSYFGFTHPPTPPPNWPRLFQRLSFLRRRQGQILLRLKPIHIWFLSLKRINLDGTVT